MIKFILALLFISFGWLSIEGQTSKIVVELSVSGHASIKNQIETCVKSELNRITDIDLYSQNPDFEIQLVVAQPSNLVAISTVVIDRVDFRSFLTSYPATKELNRKENEFIVEMIGVKKDVVLHLLNTDLLQYKDELCRDIVAKIDAEAIETLRKLKNSIEKQGSNSQDPKPKTTVKPLSSGESPFQKEYVGGSETKISIINGTDRVLTLTFGGIRYVLEAGDRREIEVDGGRYEYSASVPRARPKSGVTEFGSGYRYTWRFYIVRR